MPSGDFYRSRSSLRRDLRAAVHPSCSHCRTGRICLGSRAVIAVKIKTPFAHIAIDVVKPVRVCRKTSDCDRLSAIHTGASFQSTVVKIILLKNILLCIFLTTTFFACKKRRFCLEPAASVSLLKLTSLFNSWI